MDRWCPLLQLQTGSPGFGDQGGGGANFCPEIFWGKLSSHTAAKLRHNLTRTSPALDSGLPSSRLPQRIPLCGAGRGGSKATGQSWDKIGGGDLRVLQVQSLRFGPNLKLLAWRTLSSHFLVFLTTSSSQSSLNSGRGDLRDLQRIFCMRSASSPICFSQPVGLIPCIFFARDVCDLGSFFRTRCL